MFNIVEPTTGLPTFDFADSRVYKRYVRGDITVSFVWLNDTEAMVLSNTHSKADNICCFVIEQSDLGHYCESDGSPTARLLVDTYRAVTSMGLTPNRETMHKVADLIVNFAIELKDMPPAPDDIDEKRDIDEDEAMWMMDNLDKVYGD